MTVATQELLEERRRVLRAAVKQHKPFLRLSDGQRKRVEAVTARNRAQAAKNS